MSIVVVEPCCVHTTNTKYLAKEYALCVPLLSGA